jgi:hypothetical protein
MGTSDWDTRDSGRCIILFRRRRPTLQVFTSTWWLLPTSNTDFYFSKILH